MNSWFQESTFRKKFAIPILPEQFRTEGTVAVNLFLVHLSCRPAARPRWCCCCVPFSAGSDVCVVGELVPTGTGGFFGGEDVPCPLIPVELTLGSDECWRCREGCTVGHKVLFYCLKSVMNVSALCPSGASIVRHHGGK